MKTRTVLLCIIILFTIDQVIKIIINLYFLDVRFDIIPPLFYFKPMFNLKYSYVSSLFNLGMGFWMHILIYCFVTVFLIVSYDFLRTVSGNSKMINIAFIFGFAAVLSVLIDSFFWIGTLDYIYLKPLFVFDLKDVYINIWVILFSLYCFKIRENLITSMINHFKNRFIRKNN